MNKILEYPLGQLLALSAFFAFPIIHYAFLKSFSKKEGRPELWYLPKYGFRLVIRNKLRKKTLTDIRYKVVATRVVPASEDCSVATSKDKLLVAGSSFFLFPGRDRILFSFVLKGENDEGLHFVQTDSLGKELKDLSLDDLDRLTCDYSATIKNVFNFNMQFAKRVEIKSSSLRRMWRATRTSQTERRFESDRIQNVG